MRSMEPWLPPCDLNQSVKEILSRARTSRMPPSGSTSALTTGDVPSASEFCTCSIASTHDEELLYTVRYDIGSSQARLL